VGSIGDKGTALGFLSSILGDNRLMGSIREEGMDDAASLFLCIALCTLLNNVSSLIVTLAISSTTSIYSVRIHSRRIVEFEITPGPCRN
jgi:hypothetical protein